MNKNKENRDEKRIMVAVGVSPRMRLH